MIRVAQSRSSRSLIALLAVAAFAAIFAADPRLALLFSPLFTLVVLLSVDARLTEAIVEFVHLLGRDELTSRPAVSAPTPRFFAGPVSRLGIGPLGSRAPPAISF